MCSVDSCRFSIFKKDEEKQSKKFDFPIYQIQKFKKRPDCVECVVFTSTAKRILEGVLVTKGNLKSDVNAISDLTRAEKYLDNNIQIFSSLKIFRLI